MLENNGRTPVRINKIFTQFKGFNVTAKRLILASVLGYVGFTFIWFLFILYLEHLHVSKGEIGIAVFIMSASSTLPLIPAGYLGDKYGRIKMMFLGISITILGISLLILANELYVFYVGSMFWGFGSALYFPAFTAYLSGTVDEVKRKYLFSFQMFASTIASAVSVFFAGMMPNFFARTLNISLQNGFRGVFCIGFVFIALQILPLTLAVKQKMNIDPKHEKVENPSKTKRPYIPWKTILMLSLPSVFLGFGAGLVVPFFQVYFVWRFNTPISVIGVIFSITNFVWAIAYLFMPYVAEKLGSVKTIALLQTIAIIALIAIPLSPNFLVVVIMYLIRMVLMNATWPIFQAYSVSRVPEKHRSLTLSSTAFAFSGLNSISPGIAGYIYERNINLPFFICAIFYTVSTIIFFTYFRRKDDKTLQ